MEATKEIKGKIIYIYDALCGWCYGFSPVIKKIYEQYQNSFEFEILSGGMVMGERAGLIQPEMSEYILETIPRLEAYAQVKFGEAHKQQLKDGTLYQSSLKPSAALSAFKKILPEKAIFFASDMQYKFFYEGKSLEEDATYEDILRNYDVDLEKFITDINSDQFKYLAHLEFDHVLKLGITGFPALIGKKNNDYFWLSEGFAPFTTVDDAVKQLLAV